MNLLRKKQSKLHLVVVVIITLFFNTLTQSNVFAQTSTNDIDAYSASNDKYVFYSVSAGNNDGGFFHNGIVREDKKTKERVVLYKGKLSNGFMVCGDWLYYQPTSEYKYTLRMKFDGSEHEKFKTPGRTFIHRNRLYFSESNALKFYDLNTMDVKTASTEITEIDARRDDVGIIFDSKTKTYTMVNFDPESGVVASLKTFNLNGLDIYQHAYLMVNNGYLYFGGRKDINAEEDPNAEEVLYRSKMGDPNAQSELVVTMPTRKTGATIDLRFVCGAVMDNDCIYINYRELSSPDNGEIWRYSLDGKTKKRVAVMLTNAMSKCEDWIYTMGQWTWEQRRLNVKTGQQELLFKGKAADLSALNSLKSMIPGNPVIHPKSINEASKPNAAPSKPVVNTKSIKAEAKSDVTLYPNSPEIVVDRIYKYKKLGYSLTKDKYAAKYYRIADVAEMLSKTDRSFEFTVEGNKVTFTAGKQHAQVTKFKDSSPMPAMRRTGYFVKGQVTKPVTYYEVDGEQFYLFRNILSILSVYVNGNNVTTAPALK